MKIVVTIPAYNEENTIGKLVDSIEKVMGKGKRDYAVLVVDDGSKDGTAKAAKKAGAVVYSHQHVIGRWIRVNIVKQSLFAENCFFN